MSNLLSNNRNPRDLGSADYCGSQLRIFPRNSQPSRPGKRKYGVLFFRHIIWSWFWGYFIWKVRIESFCSCWTRSQFCGWSWLALLFGFLKSGFREAGLARLEGIKLPLSFSLVFWFCVYCLSFVLIFMCFKVLAHRYAIFLGSWDVEIDDSLVGQVTSKVQENKHLMRNIYRVSKFWHWSKGGGERSPSKYANQLETTLKAKQIAFNWLKVEFSV